MHRVLISLAANTCHDLSLMRAHRLLSRFVFPLCCSQRLYTSPAGTAGATRRYYVNQLLCGVTVCDVAELQQLLKRTERLLGRTDAQRRQGLVSIDLDLMLFDSERHHLSDWNRDYVVKLLCDTYLPKP